MKNVCIVGIQGNMGRRYKAVLDYLDVAVSGTDINGYTYQYEENKADGYIIATPTSGHLLDIINLRDKNKPILCEKPITIGMLPNIGGKELVTMVCQYQYLIDKSSVGPTYYDYFRSGSDGLIWDTINILGLAKEMPTIKNESPIWKCAINGKELSIADMDNAYIKMLMDWMKNPRSNWDFATVAHERAANKWVKK